MTPKIVCVAGPTACGKTTLGVLLAQRFHGEVVSADSMQIYRGMTVGTAAPTEAEMQGVPHIGCPLAGDWLYGTEDPDLISRPALHAYALALTHPVTGTHLYFTAPIPADMEKLI